MNKITLRAANMFWMRGVAAIEFSLVLPILVLLLSMLFFFGRVFWHYTVAQKAAHDAAYYLSSVAVRDMSPARVADTVAVARQIMDAELAELSPGPYAISKPIRCDEWTECDGLAVPGTITVGVRMRMHDPVFGIMTDAITGDNGVLITANVAMRYIGK